MRGGVTAAVVGTLALLPGTAAAHHPNPVNVYAQGNPAAGGLRFEPANVAPVIGEHVRWTNTDSFVPHTATEENGLWDLAGDYGAPGFPSGFGPGEYRERHFEAGTHRYLCKVHPQMRGTVTVVPLLQRDYTTAELRGGKRKYGLVIVTWSTVTPADGLVYDAEYRRGDEPWRPLAAGTRKGAKRFRTERRKARWSVRARLRRASDSVASDWSPVVSIKN